MHSSVRQRIIKNLLFAMALLPAVMYGILGHYSRLISDDDFEQMYRGLKYGPLNNMLDLRNEWGGSHSFDFTNGIIAPFDTFVVAAMPPIIILLWILGLTWFSLQISDILQVKENKAKLSVAVSAIIVAASIHGLPSHEALYWMAANFRYTFTLAVFIIYLAATFSAARRLSSRRKLAAAGVAGAALCFVIAGFAEAHVLFQFSASLLLLLALSLAARKSVRRNLIALVGAGAFGTFCSLLVSATAPGLHARAAKVQALPFTMPVRRLPDLFVQTLFDMRELASHPGTLAGFALLFALGVFMVLQAKDILVPVSFSRPLKTDQWTKAPYIIALIVQCALMPTLWSHSSDNPQFLGRYSAAYSVALVLNLAFILVLLLTIWRFSEFGSLLRPHARRLKIGILAAVVCAFLFAAPDLRDMHHYVISFSFISAISILSLLLWQSVLFSPEPAAKRLSLLTLAWSAATFLIAAATIAIPLFITGKIWYFRILSASAFLIVASGLVYGLLIGYMLKRRFSSREASTIPARSICALAFGAIYASIIVGQIASWPHFVTFASEWQKRDALLRNAAASGQLQVEVPPAKLDFEMFLRHGKVVEDLGLSESREQAQLRYYGLESITLIGEG